MKYEMPQGVTKYEQQQSNITHKTQSSYGMESRRQVPIQDKPWRKRINIHSIFSSFCFLFDECYAVNNLNGMK